MENKNLLSAGKDVLSISENLKKNYIPDLYFLIYKFLSGGPLKKTLKAFLEELEDSNILPKRLDWLGEKHERTVEDLLNQFPTIRPDYLLQLCCYAGTAHNSNTKKDKIKTLFNLKHSNSVDHNFKQLCDYVKRRHGVPVRQINVSSNLVNIFRGRELSGRISRSWVTSPKLYGSLQFQRRTLGHLSAVYCLLFDHSGRYIITGADDLLIKLWSSRTGRLITTFRGASSEITDIAISSDNHLLVAGSIDKMLRVWDLQTGEPVAVLSGHTGMITSVNCCPSPCWDLHYIITTSTDGSVAFWSYSCTSNGKVEFNNKPILYQEKMRPGQAQMICSSFSPGGTFLAAGSADHHVRVYYMKGDEGPHRILEIEAHTDRVDSIQWAHSGLRFLSGSKDGTAIIWNFESQQWKTTYLHMGNKPTITPKKPSEDAKKLKVTMVAWDRSDNLVITAVSDFTLKIWDARTGELVKSLTGHVDEVYVLEPHPHDCNVILSAGHDGQLFVWDIIKGETVSRYTNTIEGQGYGAIFDVKWSPDGNTIAASDSHGNLLIFGFGIGNPLFEYLPKEMFFHTDYRPLVRDQNNWVLDEQTQVPPHLMPPPFLVDVDGNPYPPMLQRLVPGRENCKTDQLVPSIVIGNEGRQEVIQVVVDDNDNPARISIDDDDDRDRDNSFIASRSSARRIRDQEGIRQSTGDWQGDSNIIWKKNVLVQALRLSDVRRIMEQIELVERSEMLEYQRQMCQRPHMICTNAMNEQPKEKNKDKRVRKQARKEVLTVYKTNSTSESSSEESGLSESTYYSDWVAEDDVNSEPKRTRRKQVNYNFDSDGGVKNEPDGSVAEAQPSSSNTRAHAKYPKAIPEQFRTSEWLSEVKPKKTPYFPQMGDELVYFPQGHQLYLDTVQARNIYEVNSKAIPWNKVYMRGHEYVKVMGISYEIKPPRICCLKLAILDEEGKLTGKVFSIKYHDMADVLDFLVLKQNFDVAMSRNWNIGDKFRCMIDDGWWIGEVVSKNTSNDEFPNSPFSCYEIKWENGEVDTMSPWDMEPLDENRTPANVGEALPVLQEELNSILYQPTPEDWPNNDRDSVTYHVLAGLAKVMELAIAEPFLVPVDLSVYPTYAYIVEYPIDLSTIKERFENRFYRRITAAQFDIRHMATNAEKFNERHSVIVKHARILTELCLRIIKQCSTLIDVTAIYHQLVDAYDSSDTDVDVEVLPSSSRMLRSLPNRYLRHASDWKMQAKTFFQAIWDCEDSLPFRAPVNCAKYPDYNRLIDYPMDLSTVKEKLHNNKYATPHDFNNDMKLIFKNSRTYNTNKRSRIYVMTVRLAAIFEEHMNKIISNWNTAKRRGRTNRANKSHSSETTTGESSDDQPLTICLKREPETEDDSDEEDNKPLTRLQLNNHQNMCSEKIEKNENQNENEKTDESDDSFKPNSRYATRGVKRLNENSNDSEESFKPSATSSKRQRRAASTSSASSSSSSASVPSEDADSDNSDDKPLSTQIKTRQNVKRLKANLTSYEEEDEEEEEEEEYTSGEESNETNESSENGRKTVYTSVSSRGRVRKLTARARALMKK